LGIYASKVTLQTPKHPKALARPKFPATLMNAGHDIEKQFITFEQPKNGDLTWSCSPGATKHIFLYRTA
jgi:hypothetical protein